MTTNWTQRFVVGYDGSDDSTLALKWAIARAKVVGASIELVHAVSGPDKSHDTLPGVTEAIDVLGEQNVKITDIEGSPASCLLKTGEDARGIVVGTRGRGVVAASIFGSTAYAVAGHSTRPVIIVRAPKDSDVAPVTDADHPLIVGIENLSVSGRVLDAAIDVARTNNAPMHLVRATSMMPIGGGLPEAGFAAAEVMSSLEEADDEVLAECKEYVKKHYPEAKVTTAREYGDAARVLIDSAKANSAGLIAVGSRGRGGFAGLLLGSVSHAVIHDAKCPVLVVGNSKD